MKSRLILSLVGGAVGAVCSIGAAEAPPDIVWARQLGTAAQDVGFCVATDTQGNAYISGRTLGSLGGPSAGAYDAILAKYDPTGALVWVRQLGGDGDDCGYAVAVDAQGNAYTGGWTASSLAGPNADGGDTFLAKYDSSGALLWARQLGTSSSDLTQSIAVDGLGNAYVTGWTLGSLGGPSAGTRDGFLAKYDASGGLIWSRQIGSAEEDHSFSVAVDSSGNAFTTGWTLGSLDGPSAGSYDGYLAKYNTAGDCLWVRQFGTSAEDRSWSVALGELGEVYITGRTAGDLAGTCGGDLDAFLAKYDASGGLLWACQLGSDARDAAWSVSVDGSGNPWISGWTEGDLSETSAGGADAFLAKYDALGNDLWVRQLGTHANDYSYSIALDCCDNAFLTGVTLGGLGGPNAGGEDAFLVKLPEPATLSLLAAGGVLVLLRRRRGRRV